MKQRALTSKAEWSKRIEEWRKSKKSAKGWCRENQIVYTTFLGWCKRLNCEDAFEPVNTPYKIAGFVELKDSQRQDSTASSAISIEYAGALIHLQANFDQETLRKCLNILRGGIC